MNNKRIIASQHFLRTYDGVEIDLAEQKQGDIYAYEINHLYHRQKTLRIIL